MAYELFKRTGVRVDSPAISVTPDGRMVLNAAASRAVAASGSKYVTLLWDKGNHQMAVKATTKGDRNGYAVSLSPDKHSGSLRARSFMRHIGWNAAQRELLPATWNEKERMFEVSLPLRCLGSKESGRRAKSE